MAATMDYPPSSVATGKKQKRGIIFGAAGSKLFRQQGGSHLSDDIHGHPLTSQSNDAASELEAGSAPPSPQEPATVDATVIRSRLQSTAIIFSIGMVTGVSSMLNGLVTVILPTLDRELHLGPELLIWPVAVTSLTCGCTLLLAGSISDALGNKAMYALGTFLQAFFVLGCGLSQNALQIILFRGLLGIAISFCLPSTVSIITGNFYGQSRNLAFAVLGAGQPVGFAAGLVLGGVLTEFYSWRLGFHISSGIIALAVALILWSVPNKGAGALSWAQKRAQLADSIDWVGTLVASASLALSSYVFAALTGDTSKIREYATFIPLAIALILVPVFLLWMDRQETLGRPALIPNSLWKNRHFSTMCLAVFLAWGSFNSLETLLTLFFQEVQGLGPLQTSLQFLPMAVSGAFFELLVGYLVHRVSANLLINVGLVVTCAAPLVMTFATPTSSFWTSGFITNCLCAVGVDALFTTANLLITDAFPASTQAQAGGVFSTVSQIGKSIGVALTAVVAGSVTAKSLYPDKHAPDALMVGYNAAFWYLFALSIITLLIGLWGFRNIGKVGHKRD